MPCSGEILSGVYQIVDEIGKGGAGIIYRAYHLNLQKYVVIKKIKDHFVGVLNARGEVDILKSLHHTYLPQVYDYLQIGNEVYTVMEYIEGYDLKYYIEQGYRFDEQVLLHWLNQLCEVLSYLHAHGILHLDIKPANIMVTSEGNICLIDFNISFAGEGESLTGISEFYAAPEQYRKWQAVLWGMEDRDAPLDAGTDIYSLGATFYHMMTGNRPHGDINKLIPIQQYQLPYSEGFVHIIGRMMNPNRKRRYQSADKVLTMLKYNQRTKEEKRTLGLVFGGMSVGIVILLVGFGIALLGGKDYSEVEQNNLEKMVVECIEQENYVQAEQYMQELFQMEVRPEYYENAAIIAAYNGEFAQAEQYIQDAEEAGVNEEGIQRSLAEIKAAQGLYDEALQIYQSLLQNSDDYITLRRMGALALRASSVDSQYMQIAIESYEELRKANMASYTDLMNLVTAYTMSGKNEMAISLLQSMQVFYPDYYQVYLQLAILKYNAEVKKPVASRDFTKIREYINEAKVLYEKNNTGEQDEQLEMMYQLIEQISE